MRKDSFEFKRIAHRGASGEAPENTLPAIRLALERDRVDIVEIDLRISKDGVPVIFHDESLERTTDGHGLLRHASLSELKTRDAGFWFDPEGRKEFPFRMKGVTIPTLEEVLREFPEGCFCLEIKERDHEIAAWILEVIRRVPRRGKLLVGSFYEKTARAVRGASLPSTETILSRPDLVRGYLAFRLGLKKFPFPSRHAFIPQAQSGVRLDDPRWIAFLHESGVRVCYWTVNDPGEMRRLLSLGADGILTDHPARLNHILGFGTR